MNITDADYNKIATYVYDIDPVDNPDKQLSVGETINVNGRNSESLMLLGTLLNQQKTVCKLWRLPLLTIKGT